MTLSMLQRYSLIAFPGILLIYGLGVSLSQALMSIAIGLSLITAATFLFDRTFWLERSNVQRAALSAIIAWCSYALLNLYFHDTDHQASHLARRILFPLVLALPVAGLVVSRKAIRWTFVVTAIAMMGLAITSFIRQASQGSSLTGLEHLPIYYSNGLVPLVVLFTELFVRKFEAPRGGRWPWLLALSIVVLAVITTGSRGPIAASLAVVFVRLFPDIFRSFRWKGVAIALLLTTVSGFTIYKTVPRVRGKVDRVLTLDLKKMGNIQGRFKVWGYNFKLIKKKPLFGVGFQRNALKANPQDGSSKYWPAGTHALAHNIYIQSLAQNGLIGFVLFFGFWGLVCLARPPIWPLVLGFGVAGLSDNVFSVSHMLHPIFFVALCLGMTPFDSRPSITQRHS